VSAAAEEVTQVDTESSDVGTSLAADPENAHVAALVVVEQLHFVDISYAEFLLDGRDERRALEASTSERVQSLLKLLDLVELSVELDNCNVLLTCGLLSLDESRRVANTGNEATSNLGIKGATVTSLVNLKDFLDP
jgi:hypothetical protein